MTAEEDDFDSEGFGMRLKEAIAPESAAAFARRIGVAQPTVSKYLNGGAKGAELGKAALMARGARVSLDWLVYGIGDGKSGDDFMQIVRYDVTLAAGAGSWNEGKRRLDDMPFTADFVRSTLRRSNTNGLVVLEGRGDSMMPTIADRALIIIDENDTRLIDDVFAFVLAGDARIKRFRRLTQGVQIISDNPTYPPETLEGAAMDSLQVIGRALWVGQPLR